MFSPLYYLGCKANFVPPIIDAINEVGDHGPACDLFAGTGAVASAMSQSRQVTTVDVQEYSRVLCAAQLSPAQIGTDAATIILSRCQQSPIGERLRWCYEPLLQIETQAIERARAGDAELAASLLELSPLVVREQSNVQRLRNAKAKVEERLKFESLFDSSDSTVTRYFGGLYFSYEQSIFLDSALACAAEAEPALQDTLRAICLSTASTVVNTIGKQFAQPIRPREKSGAVKHGVASKFVRDRSMNSSDVFSAWLFKYGQLNVPSYEHKAIRSDYLVALRTLAHKFAVVYADPPYTRDHYSRFYHVLETMCLRDEPELAIVKSRGRVGASRGVYRSNRHQSPFCIRSTAPNAMSALFEECRSHGLAVVLSYSPHDDGDGTHPRVLSSADILEIAKRHYSKVNVDLLDGSTHNKLNRTDLKLEQRKHAEMIVKCKGPKRASLR